MPNCWPQHIQEQDIVIVTWAALTMIAGLRAVRARNLLDNDMMRGTVRASRGRDAQWESLLLPPWSDMIKTLHCFAGLSACIDR
jgi:hypothetical protein